MSQLILATEALADDEMTRRELLRKYRKIHHNVYAPRDLEMTARDNSLAAWLWSGRTATLSGLSAAAVLGSKWIPRDSPAELVRAHPQAPPGIVVHRDVLADDETRHVDGVRCTTAARTAFDLGRRLPFEEGLIRVDALFNATRIAVDDVADLAARHPGARDLRRLDDVLDIADGGAESPQETRTRLILIEGGLPRPTTQIPIGFRRIDMGWPEWKVGVEYEGVQHWDDREIYGKDIERQELFRDLGFRIVRVVADHVWNNPQGIVNRAERALRAAGWRGELMPRPRKSSC